MNKQKEPTEQASKPNKITLQHKVSINVDAHSMIEGLAEMDHHFL